MAQKSANLYARIEPSVKEQAETILATLGLSASNAVNLFYRQIILRKGLPFEVALPVSHPLNLANMTEAKLAAELQKGIDDINEGRVTDAAAAFAELQKELNL